jgi:AraC-like DNA-binding protein
LYTLYEISPCNIYSDEQSYTSIEHKIYEITSYIHNNYDKELSLESLAEMYYLSPSYLSREFKAITHFNLLNYIQQTRIKNAQYKLSSTNEKISAIAESCGFTSFSQFNRVFNKISGTSPREYRNTVSHKFS